VNITLACTGMESGTDENGDCIYKEMADLEHTAATTPANITAEQEEVASQVPPLRVLVPALMGSVQISSIPAGMANTGSSTSAATGDSGQQQQHHQIPSSAHNIRLALENRSKDTLQMDTEETASLPNTYYQCRAARDANFSDASCAITGNEMLGTAVGGEVIRVGSFENSAAGMDLCFIGTRIRRGNPEVPQNATFSFDPATLTCVCCEKSHPLFVEGGTACICVSDQNFPANLSGAGTGCACVAVIRVESASLLELVEIFSEIFVGKKIPGGTTICLGSATHLHRAGPTIYATDWVAVNQDFARLFPGTNICPLIPTINTDFPGSLAISTASLTAWFSTVYASETRGLIPVWAEASKLVCASAIDSSDTTDKTFLVHAFPASLQPGAKLIPRRIAIIGSCRGRAPPPPAKANLELVRQLLAHLHTDFLIGYAPGENPVREKTTAQRPKDDIKTAIVYGNSNMRQCVPALQALGYTVLDRTAIKWDGSDAAIDALKMDVDAHTGIENAAFIFDFLTPIAYRFRQSDGSLAMPVKLAGGFHLLGEVTTADDAMLRSCINRLGPVLNAMGSKPKIFIPPLPRFVFGGCCRARNHAPGSGTDTASKTMIGKIAHLRKTAKSELQKSGLNNWWIADTLTALGGEDGIGDMKNVMAGDNVHFTGSGYAKIATEVSECLGRLSAKSQKPASKPQTFHWHGFVSPNGASGLRRDAGKGRGTPPGSGGGGFYRGNNRGAARGHRYNPYQR